MKPPPFHYHDPRSLEEALECLARLENTKLLAGGQSLMPMLNMRYVFPDHVIDLNRIPSLDFIREADGAVEIGAMTRQRELERSDLIRRRLPLMREALAELGHVAIRNRGTIGGSLCHLDPAGELPLAAAAMDATIHVSSAKGSREVPMAEFPSFYMTPSIEPDELVTAARFVPWPPDHGSAFVEFSRRHGDFAVVAVAALLRLEPDGSIDRARVVIGGVTDLPFHLEAAGDMLPGRRGGAVFREVAEACREIDATEDIHAPAAYRRHLAEVLTVRALERAFDRVRSREQ